MANEFQIPSLRIQVKERLSEKESKRIWLETWWELEEHQIASLLQLELEQRRRKSFIDKHRRGNEKEFGIGKLVLVFQTRMGNMPGKLRFRWISPFWVTKEFVGSYQLGTLAGELLSKWVNDFRLKPYKARMLENPFKETENPRSTKGWSETGDTPVVTGVAPEATGSIELGPTDK